MTTASQKPTMTRTGELKDGSNINKTIRALAQFQCRISASAVSAPTDSSGGTAATNLVIASVAADAVNIAVSGSNLADKTTSEAAFGNVIDALGELFAKANGIANVLGVAAVTNSLGGAAPDGTIGAVANSVTGATTGIPAAAANVFFDGVNRALYDLTTLVNKLAHATGRKAVKFAGSVVGVAPRATVPVLTTATGTAVAPGVAKAQVDAKLASLRNDVATLAAKVTEIRTQGTPPIVAVR